MAPAGSRPARGDGSGPVQRRGGAGAGKPGARTPVGQQPAPGRAPAGGGGAPRGDAGQRARAGAGGLVGRPDRVAVGGAAGLAGEPGHGDHRRDHRCQRAPGRAERRQGDEVELALQTRLPAHGLRRADAALPAHRDGAAGRLRCLHHGNDRGRGGRLRAGGHAVATAARRSLAHAHRAAAGAGSATARCRWLCGADPGRPGRRSHGTRAPRPDDAGGAGAGPRVPAG